jgi:hypothetical protein
MAKEHEHGTSGGCVIGQIASGLGAAARRRAASCASGPAQVATERYRTTWEQTFGGRKAVRGEA